MVATAKTPSGQPEQTKPDHSPAPDSEISVAKQLTSPPAQVVERVLPGAGPASIAPPRSSKVAKALALRAFQAIDLLVLAVAGLYAFTTVSPLSLGMAPFSISAPFVSFPILTAIGLQLAGSYGFSHGETLLKHWGKTLAGLLIGIILSVLVAVISNLPPKEMTVICTALGMASLAVVCLHANYLALISSWTRSGKLGTNVVMVGATGNARGLIEENAKTGELFVAGIFEDRAERAPQRISGVPVLGSIEDLLAWEHLPNIDRIIITVTSTATTRVRQMVDRLRNLPQNLVLFVDMGNFNPEQTTLAEIANAPMANISGGPQDEMRVVQKRVQDMIFASLMLVAFAPVMALVALAIKLDSKGPVLFRQKRHGFNNTIIEVFKFRSMRAEQASGPMVQVADGDDRITKVGRFIRRTSLDELPQLFNVLMGNMSLVGPRPHAVDMHTGDVQSRLLVAEYAHRHRVKPGLTGWAQINGSRGPLHSADDVRERVRLDVEYIDRAGFWFDLMIMLKTAPCLLGDSENTR
ncbi:hypothetical protein MNBD_ALPHA06-1605 [hydrothermal vent metagenome]|uniref:Bacterial sugar transferase domain-containing protein n=1 Tax=hydrothermal vent metagenome TaxID=652676 RepID=A0A3B0RLM3_9ZZZZ